MTEAPLTDGFSFLEFVHPEPESLVGLFERLGFRTVARGGPHDAVNVLRQGAILFVVNGAVTPFLKDHGPSVRGLGVRVWDQKRALDQAVEAGAGQFSPQRDGAGVIDSPAALGIGDSLIYFVDASGPDPFADYIPSGTATGDIQGVGLARLDHTSNIVRGDGLERWANFYARALGFRERQYLDVKGSRTGMRARSMVGACGKLSIPIAAGAHDQDGAVNQNDEFIRDLGGEGIQHIAMETRDILTTVDRMRSAGFEFMDAPPDTYYDAVDTRLPGHGLNVGELRRRGILVDGKPGGQTLLQIFTRRQFGPVFFEIIQRNREDGFGEGNFKALFEAQEKDQERRGTAAA